MNIPLKLAYQILKLTWFFTRPITVGVRVLPIQDDKILLVYHSYQSAWYIPGGGVKRQETLEQALRREAYEEFGGELGALELFGIYTSFTEYKNDHVVVFLCREFTLTGMSDHEIQKVAWFPIDELPTDTAPGCYRRVQEYLTGYHPHFGSW